MQFTFIVFFTADQENNLINGFVLNCLIVEKIRIVVSLITIEEMLEVNSLERNK